MRMEMALKMEMMGMIINHRPANIQTRAHAVRVMQISPLLLVRIRPFLHGFRVMRVDKYWFENFFHIESQNLETQS